LLEVRARPQHVSALLGQMVGIKVIVPAENEIHGALGLLGKLDVIRLAHVGQRDDQLAALLAQLWGELEGDFGG
jgi:hypothetical protein